MDVIHDSLEDGAELMFRSEIDVAPAQLQALLRSKEELKYSVRSHLLAVLM